MWWDVTCGRNARAVEWYARGVTVSEGEMVRVGGWYTRGAGMREG